MRSLILVGLVTGLFAGSLLAQGTARVLHADRVVVLKKERTLELLSQGKVIKTYKVALGGEPVGPKKLQGDHKTPEGLYVLDFRNSHSQFYKSIHISYPNAGDRAAARQRGLSPGGDVFVQWSAERLRLAWGVAPGQRLDRRVHRGHESRDRRDLVSGRRQDPD